MLKFLYIWLAAFLLIQAGRFAEQEQVGWMFLFAFVAGFPIWLYGNERVKDVIA